VRRVLLLATTTGYQIRSFGEAAEKLGVRLVFASDRCDQLEDPWWDQAIPIRFQQEYVSVETVTRALAVAPPEGILAVGDRPVVVAARIAEALGLPGHSPPAASVSRSKLASRRAFKAAGLATPSFDTCGLDADAAALARVTSYPAVLKPLALSGSRGVMRVDDEHGFVDAFERLRGLLWSPDVRQEQDPAHDQVIIESFIPGREFAVEALLTDGRLTVLAIFDKPDPLDGPFFEETIYVTPSRESPDVQKAIAFHVEAAVRAIGLHHGPLHAECRVNPSGVYVLEVAARPIGGLCSRALRFVGSAGAQASLEEVLLRHALGEDVATFRREALASGVMMIPIPRQGLYKTVEGVDDALSVPGVTEIRIAAKPDTRLVPLPEGRSYLGFIFARAVDAAAVESSLRDAHARLRFVIEREIAIVQR
jgi:biotin carboxylase